MSVVEEVSRVLVEHMLTDRPPPPAPRGAANGCVCGWWVWGAAHSLHVAEILEARGLLAEDALRFEREDVD